MYLHVAQWFNLVKLCCARLEQLIDIFTVNFEMSDNDDQFRPRLILKSALVIGLSLVEEHGAELWPR